VRSRLVPARSQLLGSLPRLWRRLLGQPTGSPAMPRSEDRWRPACRPLATARSRRVTFHLYKRTEQRRTVAAGSGGKLGSLSGETKRDRLQASPSHRTEAQIVPGPPRSAPASRPLDARSTTSSDSGGWTDDEPADVGGFVLLFAVGLSQSADEHRSKRSASSQAINGSANPRWAGCARLEDLGRETAGATWIDGEPP
jgi:hypothetical protein